MLVLFLLLLLLLLLFAATAAAFHRLLATEIVEFIVIIFIISRQDLRTSCLNNVGTATVVEISDEDCGTRGGAYL